MRIEQEIYLDFDDVLIRPKRSLAASRKDVDLKREFKFLHSDYKMYCTPLIAANMSCTGTFDMATTFRKKDCLVALHKFYTAQDEYYYINRCSIGDAINWWTTLGITDIQEYNERDQKKQATFLINVDIANGYTETFVNTIRELRKRYKKHVIMAGNVATPEMVQELLIAGADIVKIGIGPGSVCSTRLIAGVGVPQLSSIIMCAETAHGMNGHICADGGCRTPGDVCKAFGAGADFVMIGGMLAGTDECEGYWEYGPEVLWDGNVTTPHKYTGKQIKKRLQFYGMSSEDAMIKYYGKKDDYRAAEGKTVWVDYKGSASKVLEEILGGLRSCGAYVGAKSLKDLSKCTTFVKVNRTHNTVFGG